MQRDLMRRSLQVSLIAVFASLHANLYLISFGLWRNWGIYLETIEGIILGPLIGPAAAFLGGGVGRMLRFDSTWMFGLAAEPFSVFTAGLLAKGSWKPALAAYAVMASAYFLDPVGRALPLWTVLDILLAVIIILPAAKFGKNLLASRSHLMPLALALISFVAIAADSLVRVFILVPCRLYTQLFGSFDVLQGVFILSSVDSYIEDLLCVGVSLSIGIPLLLAVSRLGIVSNNAKEKVKIRVVA